MTVCVVGLGKIGLPLAVQIAGQGLPVIGADSNPLVVAAVNAGREPFPGEPDLESRMQQAVNSGSLVATSDTTDAVSQSATVIIVVPLVVDNELVPDFGAIDSATDAVARGLQAGTLVSYETTLPVQTTRLRFAPALARGSGLEVGRDLFVCHSPERVSSGRIFDDLRRYPKLIGATDPVGAKRAVDFYESVLDFDPRPDLERANGVWDLGSAEAAELTKLAETTYRNVNIAYANELAIASDRLGVDVRAVIEASNSQPFSHIHQPGIAVGGHCIPVYPYFLLAGDDRARLVRTSLEVNNSMPGYAVGLLDGLLGGLAKASVVVLGAAYRGEVKETAFSGVFPVVAALEEAGATVTVHDPLYSDEELVGLGLRPHQRGTPCDGVIVQTDHLAYRSMGPEEFPGVRGVVDGRGVLSSDRWQGIGLRRIGSSGP